MDEEQYAALGRVIPDPERAEHIATLFDIVCDVFANEMTLLRRRMIGDDTVATYVHRVANCMRGRQSLVRYLGGVVNRTIPAKVLPSTGRVTIPAYLFEGSFAECASTVDTQSTFNVGLRRHPHVGGGDGSICAGSQLTSTTAAGESERIVQLEMQLALVQRQMESLMAERQITIAAQKVANWETHVPSQSSPTSQADAGFCEARSVTSVGPSGSASLIDIAPMCSAPPPPPPPPPVSLMARKPQTLSLPSTSRSSNSLPKPAPSMADVLKGLSSVTLKKVNRSPGGTPTKSRRRSSATSRTPSTSKTYPARSIASALRLHLNEKFKNVHPSGSDLDESVTEQDWADDDDEPTVFMNRGDVVVPTIVQLPAITAQISPSRTNNEDVDAVVEEIVNGVVGELRETS